jgi:hypothetical protein
MALATTGAERGAREEPASDSIAFDDAENRIIERVEGQKNAAQGVILNELARTRSVIEVIGHTDGRLTRWDEQGDVRERRRIEIGCESPVERRQAQAARAPIMTTWTASQSR